MIRAALSHDIEKLIPLVRALWPDHPQAAYASILSEYIGKTQACCLIDTDGSDVLGIVFSALRHDYIEGCETSPVGYLEGIYVKDAYRRKGIAKMLVKTCEQWAKDQGCSEFASDCELTNIDSLRFHLGIGFHEENRIICFKKRI